MRLYLRLIKLNNWFIMIIASHNQHLSLGVRYLDSQIHPDT